MLSDAFVESKDYQKLLVLYNYSAHSHRAALSLCKDTGKNLG